MPLIISINRKMKCNCDRNEHFSCLILNCATCICKRCTDEKDIQETHFISVSSSNSATIVEELEIDAKDILIEPFDEETDPFCEENIDDIIGNLFESDLLSNDHYDDFVTESEDPYIPNEENDEDANDFSFDLIPSTNSGEFPFNIEEEIPKKGVCISGHAILNQCGSVLTRKNIILKEAIFKSHFFSVSVQQ